MRKRVLLPCPFCGGPATLAVDAWNSRVKSVVCDDCHAEGPARPKGEDAVALWNRRMDGEARHA